MTILTRVRATQATAAGLIITVGQLANSASAFAETRCDQNVHDLDCLPAWRWQDVAADFYVRKQGSGGLFGVFRNITTAIARGLSFILFMIAGFIWRLLIALILFAANSNLLANAASVMNRLYATIAKPLQTGGLLAVVVVVAFIGMAWKFGRSKGKGDPKLVRNLVSTGVAIGLFIGMLLSATAAMNAEKSYGVKCDPDMTVTPNGDVVAQPGFVHPGAFVPADCLGSPGFLAAKISWTIRGLTGSLTNSIANSLAEQKRDDDPLLPSCNSYNAELYNRYGNSMSGAAAKLVSAFWETGYLNMWIKAQYGDLELGQRAACHQMDRGAGIPLNEQWYLTTKGVKGLEGTAAPPVSAFGPYAKTEGFEQSLIGFATCRLSDSAGWVTNNKVFSAGPGMPTDDDCAKWWQPETTTVGDGDTAYEAAKFPDRFNFKNTDRIDSIPADGARGAKFVDTLQGNGTAGLVALVGIFAIVIAAIYLFTFGGLAIGVLIAEIGVVVAVGLLPIVLMATIAPDKNEQNELQKYLRLVFGLMLMGAVFNGLFGFLAIVTTGLQAASEQLVDNDWMSTILFCLNPLLAFIATKMVAKKIGLAKIGTFSGAMTAGFAFGAGSMFGIAGGEGMLGLRQMRRLAAPYKWNRYRRMSNALLGKESRFGRGGGGRRGPAGPTRMGRGGPAGAGAGAGAGRRGPATAAKPGLMSRARTAAAGSKSRPLRIGAAAAGALGSAAAVVKGFGTDPGIATGKRGRAATVGRRWGGRLAAGVALGAGLATGGAVPALVMAVAARQGGRMAGSVSGRVVQRGQRSVARVQGGWAAIRAQASSRSTAAPVAAPVPVVTGPAPAPSRRRPDPSGSVAPVATVLPEPRKTRRPIPPGRPSPWSTGRGEVDASSVPTPPEGMARLAGSWEYPSLRSSAPLPPPSGLPNMPGLPERSPRPASDTPRPPWASTPPAPAAPPAPWAPAPAEPTPAWASDVARMEASIPPASTPPAPPPPPAATAPAPVRPAGPSVPKRRPAAPPADPTSPLPKPASPARADDSTNPDSAS